MNRNYLIAERLREVFLNGKWIANTNFNNEITGVNFQQAITRVGNSNSIALLVFHLNYYLEGLLQALDTGKLTISDQFSFAMPAIASEEEWNTLRSDFLKNAEQFANRVERMPDSDFDLPFVDPAYGTLLRNIEGVIEHGYYHLGQVVLLRKMMVDVQEEHAN